MTIDFTEDQFDLFMRRVKEDGTTRHAAAKRLLLNYAKNGLGDG